MKVLLYLEAQKLIAKSGIGRALRHQERALTLAGVDYTHNINEDYDIVHINTYGLSSRWILRDSRRRGKKVIVHAHSTKEDFENSFTGSNWMAPLVKSYLIAFYKQADHIITPTNYSKKLLLSYGITVPITPISNGIELSRYIPSKEKESRFREYFGLKSDGKAVISAGLYFKRKGIIDFVKVAAHFPDVAFIWFGQTNRFLIPKAISDIVKFNHPNNVYFPGYIEGDIFEGAMSGANAFFFPSYEETEGIVVLEALASKQNIIVRDIPVYEGWLDSDAVNLCRDNFEFIHILHQVISGKIDKSSKGYQIAESRSLECISEQLVKVYKEVMES